MILRRREFLIAAAATACGAPPEQQPDTCSMRTALGLGIGLCFGTGGASGGGGDPDPPNPVDLGVEGQPIQITASGGAITIDGESAGTYSGPFLWTALPGQHTIQVGSDVIVLNVVPRAPRLIAPKPGRVVIGDTVTFTAEVFDDAETTEVEFLRSDEVVANDAGSSPWSDSYTEAGSAEDTTAYARRITGGTPVVSPEVAYRVIADPGSAPALPTADTVWYSHSGVSVVEVSTDEHRVSAVTPVTGNDITAPSDAARPWLVYDALDGHPAIRFRGPHELGRAANGVNLGDGGCYAVAFRMRYTNGGLQTIIRSNSAPRQMLATTGSGLSNGVGGTWSDGSWRLANFSNTTGGSVDQGWHIAMCEFHSDTTPDVLRIDGATIISSDLTTAAGTGIQFGDDSIGVIGVHFEIVAAVVHSSGIWDATARAAVAAHLRHAANFPSLPEWVEP